RLFIAVGDAGISIRVGAIVPSESAVRQKISERMANKFTWLGIADEVSLARGITPGALRIPVPRLHEQLRVLAVRERLPSGREHLLHDWLSKKFVGRRNVDAINAGAKRFDWNEFVDFVADINVNGLS